MQKVTLTALAVVSLTAPVASALTPIANYRSEYQPVTPAVGWGYGWNANGPIAFNAGQYDIFDGTSYAALTYDATDARYETTGVDPNGTSLYVGPNNLYPGKAVGQDGNPYERYAIVSYTLQPSDVSNNPAETYLYLESFSFAVSSVVPPFDENSGDPYPYGLNARVFLDGVDLSRIAYGGPIPLDPNSPFTEATFGGGAFALGPASVGSTITFAIGASGPATYPLGGAQTSYVGNNIADEVSLDFTLALGPAVPEPTGFAVLALAGVGLLARRRRA